MLPLVRDMGGVFGFTVEGRAVSLGWDDLEAPPTPTRFVGYMLQGRQLAASLYADWSSNAESQTLRTST